MKILFKKERNSAFLHDGKFYDTGREMNLPFSEAYRAMRVAPAIAEFDFVPYDPSLWASRKFINFSGDIDLQSGFGNVSYYLVKESMGELEIALTGKTYGVSDRAVFAGQGRPLDQAGAMLWHAQPTEQWLYSPFKKNIAIIPWETTLIPKSWVDKINSFDAMMTCCQQNVEAFRNSGITIPIEVIHWGIDPTKFYPVSRPERPIFTFGHMGALSLRKGTDIVRDAFLEEFPTEQDVRMICKTSYNTYTFGAKDKRIEVQITSVSPQELMENFFKRIDCFVFPTRGEGFGLTPLEAMATGVPAIVTGWAGPTEYMTPETGWLIDYKMVPAKNFTEHIYKEQCGDWAEPDKAQLRSLMRNAYEHRDEVRQKGEAAAKYVQQNWLWRDKIKMFHEALNKFL